MDCSTTGFLVLHYLLELLKFMFIESVMLSNHLILCRPRLPSIFPSIQVFSNGLALSIRWPKYFSFSFSISPSSEYSGLTSFRIDWFDLLAVQGTLKSLLRLHSSVLASLLPCRTALVLLDRNTSVTKTQFLLSSHSEFLFSLLGSLLTYRNLQVVYTIPSKMISQN